MCIRDSAQGIPCARLCHQHGAHDGGLHPDGISAHGIFRIVTQQTTLPSTPVVASKASLLRATGVALVIAIIVLTTAVLPAEFGIDPTGAGKVLGLAGMNSVTAPTVVPKAAAAGGPITDRPKGYKVDAIEFTLIPGDSVEYKYHLGTGRTPIRRKR